MKKEVINLKFGIINPSCLINGIEKFISVNSFIPSIILLTRPDFISLQSQHLDFTGKILLNEVTINGINMKLEVVSRLSSGEIEIH